MQNVFHQGKEMRNISLNTHYIILFKSPRDRQQISILAKQVNPGRVQEFMKRYEKATSQAHRYLMLDLKPTTDDEEQLKTNILPGETNALEQIHEKEVILSFTQFKHNVQYGKANARNYGSTTTIFLGEKQALF